MNSFPDGENISYEEEFEEMRCIGRGNFGAAFLVKLRNSPEGEDVYFIAKKIILNQLTQKEQEGAHLEVRKHDFIFSYIIKFICYRLNYWGNWIIQTLCLINIPLLKKVFWSLLWSIASMVIWLFMLGKRKVKENNLLKLKSWIGSCNYVYPWTMFIAEKFFIEISNLKTFFSPKLTRLSLEILVFQKCSTAPWITRTLFRELHITCHQRFAKTNHTPISQIFGPWVVYYMSFAL